MSTEPFPTVTPDEIDKALSDPLILKAAEAAHEAWRNEQFRQMGKKQGDWALVVRSGYALRLNVASTLAVKKVLEDTGPG